jgi:hypothetical protein
VCETAVAAGKVIATLRRGAPAFHGVGWPFGGFWAAGVRCFGPALHCCNGICFDSTSDEADGSVLDPLEDLEVSLVEQVMKTFVPYSRMGRA